MRYALEDRRVTTEGDDWWIAPNAVAIGDVILKRNASVWWGAVLRGDNEPITIGENSNIQDGSVLHTDPGLSAADRPQRHGRPYGDAARLHDRRRDAGRHRKRHHEWREDRKELPDRRPRPDHRGKGDPRQLHGDGRARQGDSRVDARNRSPECSRERTGTSRTGSATNNISLQKIDLNFEIMLRRTIPRNVWIARDCALRNAPFSCTRWT